MTIAYAEHPAALDVAVTRSRSQVLMLPTPVSVAGWMA
jgi:hypothetical protein